MKKRAEKYATSKKRSRPANAASRAIQRYYYLGVGATVSRLQGSGDTRSAWVTTLLSERQRRDFDRGPFLPVDLKWAVGTVASIDDALFDDVGVDLLGGKIKPGALPTEGVIVTSIGETWPQGEFQGALYIEHRHYLSERAVIEHDGVAWPPKTTDREDPELSAQYLTVRHSETQRYIGFGARLAASVPEDAAEVELEIWNPRRGAYYRHTIPFVEIDADVPADCIKEVQVLAPVVRPGLKVPSGGPRTVSVFVSDKYAASRVDRPGFLSGFASPKLPFWMD